MFLLKIQYEKYFSGLERIEPLKEREDLRRFVRELMQEPITNTMQKHKFRTLKARYNSMELYWQRNITMIERGTHPKMKFRANMKDQNKRDAPSKDKKWQSEEKDSQRGKNKELSRINLPLISLLKPVENADRAPTFHLEPSKNH